MKNEVITINDMDKPFFLLGNYSVTTQHLVETIDDEWMPEENDNPEIIYENFTSVELSSVYATADKKYVVHCTQYSNLEGEDGKVPFEDNSEVINHLYHYRLDEIFKQYDCCTIIISQVRDVATALTIIPNEVIINSTEIFQYKYETQIEDPYCKYLIYDKNKDAFVEYNENEDTEEFAL